MIFHIFILINEGIVARMRLENLIHVVHRVSKAFACELDVELD